MQSAKCLRSFPARVVTTWAVSLVWSACGGGDLVEPATGDIVVRTTTAGAPSDASGYVVAIDGGEPRPIGPNDAITVAGLVPGDHTVQLTGLAEACTVAGDNPRTVTVPSDGSVEAAFEITCPPPPSSIAVTVSTAGALPDPDGYTLQVDRAPGLPIGVNATLVVPDIAPGEHTVQLNGLAPNCTVAGPNPRTVEIVANAPVTVEFEVTCAIGMLRWTQMTSGTVADLPDVWGTGSSDVFVVGETDTDDGSVAALVLHYDGTSWSPQYRQGDLRLSGVWGSGPRDVFAVGFHFLTPGAVVLRYDGSRWTQTENFVGNDEDFSLRSVWGSSATDVYSVGGASDNRVTRALIAHFDGTEWLRIPGPASPSPNLFDVWGSGPTDVYAVGLDEESDPPSGVILHSDGTSWTPVLQLENALFNAVWGSSATDVFAVGFELVSEFESAGTVWHFDGAGWSRMTLPRVSLLQEVWGSSATDVYAVGDEGQVLHFDGVEWTQSRPSRQNLLGVWGSSPADVFVVGNRGTILHGTP